MGLYKRHVPNRGLTWEQAVPEAICWGWIDSKIERIDADAIRQRWTPRRKGSNWSRVNIALAEQLIEQGRMQPAGLAAFEARKREAAGYTHEAGELELPPDYAGQLAANAAATAFWAAATESYRRICINWVLTAKQQATRDRRMAQLVECCADGLLIPSQRYGEPPRWVERAAKAAAEQSHPG